MKKNIEVVVFDFDGTIRDTRLNYVPQSTLDAIRLLRKKYKVYLATGRNIHILKYPGLDLNDFDAIICNNGSSGYTNTKELLYTEAFQNETVEKIIDYCSENAISLTIQTPYIIYSTPTVNKYHQDAYEYFKEHPEDVKEYEQEPVLLMNAYQYQGYDYSKLKKLTNIKVIEGPTTHVDLMLKHVDKAFGIKKMMEIQGIKGLYMAFGDQENDLEMLQNAAISIAVKDQHGSKNIQKIADYVCESSGDDGIYAILQQLQFID